MTAILDIIRDFRTAQGEVFRIEGTQDGPYAAVDPRRMRIEAAAGASGRIVVVHTPRRNAERRIFSWHLDL